jgi:hypothetical protein
MGRRTAWSPSMPWAVQPLPRQLRRSPPSLPGWRSSDRLGPGGGVRVGWGRGPRPREQPRPRLRAAPEESAGRWRLQRRAGAARSRKGVLGAAGPGRAGPRAPSPGSWARGRGGGGGQRAGERGEVWRPRARRPAVAEAGAMGAARGGRAGAVRRAPSP